MGPGLARTRRIAMKTTKRLTESRAAVLCGIFVAAAMSLSDRAPANDESGISTTPADGQPSACLEDDLKALLQACIARNKTNPPPGNPGPFNRGYKEIILLMGQCFSGGFTNLVCIGDNIIVGAAADPRKEAHAGERQIPNFSPKPVMIWFEVLNELIRRNTNAPLKDILDAARANNPDTPSAMTPPPMFSPGGDRIVMGDGMTNRPGDSFHAVLFGGVNDLFNKNPGEATARDAVLGIAIANALKDMRATLQFFLNIPGTNIQVKGKGTYAELGAMITNAWRHMNDNEQFILFIADHGSRHCQKTNLAPRAGGNGFSAAFATEPYLKSQSIDRPVVGLNTSFVGPAGGEVRFNAHCIGMLPPGAGPASHEFFFNPNWIKPVGQNNLVEIVAPGSNIGVTMVDLSTGPVLGSDFSFGAEPMASVINVRNATGSSKTGFQIVYDGMLNGSVTAHARRTQADGTPISVWAVDGFTIDGDITNGVTILNWRDAANPIPDGGYASFSVEASRTLRSLKYTWTPASPDPAMDLAPANLKSIQSVTSSTVDLRLLAPPLMTSTQTIRFSLRFSPNRIPASQFYFNDPAIASLPGSSTQAVALLPDSLEQVSFPLPSLPDDAPLPTALVVSLDTWDNGATPNNISRINQIPIPPPADTTCVTNCPGSGAFFTVNLAGGAFRWYKNGELIPGQTGGTLTLLNLNQSDAGIYTGVGTSATETKRKFFKLSIEDNVPPTVNCPADITVKATNPNGALVNYGSGIGAADSCGRIDGSTFQCSPPPGLFPVGTTEVACSVADTFGNIGRCAFNVTVLPQGADLVINANRTYAVLRWSGTGALLQCAPKVTGPWATMSKATSPYIVPIAPGMTESYFRLHLR